MDRTTGSAGSAWDDWRAFLEDATAGWNGRVDSAYRTALQAYGASRPGRSMLASTLWDRSSEPWEALPAWHTARLSPAKAEARRKAAVMAARQRVHEWEETLPWASRMARRAVAFAAQAATMVMEGSRYG